MNTKGHNAEKELDLGKRKVSTMNFSKVVTLPKTFTENYLDTDMVVQMTLTSDGKLVLSPAQEDKRKGGN